MLPRWMNPLRSTCLAAICLCAAAASAQQFNWTWDETGEIDRTVGSAPAMATPEDEIGNAIAEPEPAQSAADARGEEKAPAAAPVQPVPLPPDLVAEPEVETAKPEPAAGVAPFPGGAAAEQGRGRPVDVSVYGEVLQENVMLRREIEKAAEDKEAINRQNLKLRGEVTDLEKRISEFAVLINQLQGQKSASAQSADTNQVMALEKQLADAEAEKARLKREMDALEERVAALAATPAPAAGEVKSDSDLFRQTEAENLRLRKQLAELQKAQEEAARAREMAEQLKTMTAEREEQKSERRKLSERLPLLEQELNDLRATAQQKSSELLDRQRDMEAMQAELERREDRIRKQERMADLMEKTREEVKQVSDAEKRDMHYNMALVYVKEGRFAEARDEYLRALRIDPSDAEVHYNLAILYDDELNEDRLAAMHYRKYLRLRPSAPDVDQVKDWLMRIDMGR